MASQKLAKEDYLHGFGVIFSYVRRFAYDAKVLATLSIVESIGDAVIPVVTGKFFDALVHDNIVLVGSYSFSRVYTVLGLWLLIQTVSFIVSSYRWYKTNILTDKLFASYSEQSIHHLIDLPLSFHKEEKMAVVTNTLQRSANDLASVFTRVVTGFGMDILTLIISLVFVLTISPLLSVILFAGVALYTITIWKVLAPGAELQRKNHKAWQKSWTMTHEGVDNISTVKAMVSENYEKKKITKSLFSTIASQLKLHKMFFKSGFIQNAITTVTRFVIFGLSIYLVFRGSLTIGQLIAFNSYVGMFFSPFINFTNYWQSLQNAFISINESERILKIEAESYHPHDAVAIKKFTGHIEFKNVNFAYERKSPIIQNISVEIKPGEVVALVGKSGEGKSTFLNLLAGHYFPQKGVITVDGIPTSKLDLKSLRSQMASVPQEVVLFNDTIEANIRYGTFKATKERVRRAAEQAHALEFIERMPNGWNQLVGERGYRLSVGQKQRIAIARAILRDPKILILDEPTSALDAESEFIIQKSLAELMKGRTTFIIAHRLSTVRHADKILVFKGGRIVEAGTHSELVAKEVGVYRNLHDLQMGLH